jgi:hypothetical protein
MGRTAVRNGKGRKGRNGLKGLKGLGYHEGALVSN